MIIQPNTIINGIGLRGKRRSGKNTFLRELQRMAPVFERVSCADPLKDQVCEAFGVSRGWLERNKENPIVRTTMQAWGKRAKEMFGDDYWMKLADAACKNLMRRDYIPVITDVRFPIEVEYCKSAGFVLVEILGKKEYEGTDAISQDISETAIDHIESDFVIDNKARNLTKLLVQIEQLMAQLVKSKHFYGLFFKK